MSGVASQCPDCGASFRGNPPACPECGIELFDEDPDAELEPPAPTPDYLRPAMSIRANTLVTCDYDTDARMWVPSKCGDPAEFTWIDKAKGRDRPVCGIHARTVQMKWHDEVRPIGEDA
jgi:hypothetical protein